MLMFISVFFFKQKTAYERRISDWSSDVCSSDLVDTNTSEKCLPKFREKLPSLKEFDIIEIDAGEAHKNIDYCVGIWKMLLDFGAGRDSLLINLGGGMVTDMGSFAASTYKRGIDFIQVPTTLLSQVDASVGGKTGIDIDNVKNTIGRAHV